MSVESSTNETSEVVVKKRLNIVGVIITFIVLAIVLHCGRLVYNNMDVISIVEETYNGYYYDCELTYISGSNLLLKDEGNGFRSCKVKDSSKYEVGQTVRVITNKDKVVVTLEPEVNYQIKVLFNNLITLLVTIVVWILLIGLTDWAALIHEYEYEYKYDEEYMA